LTLRSAAFPTSSTRPCTTPAVTDSDTGELISDAEVSEVEFTAFAGTCYETTGRLIVRRVLDANTQDPLFPVWRYTRCSPPTPNRSRKPVSESRRVR
jgi:hypothetical protein